MYCLEDDHDVASRYFFQILSTKTAYLSPSQTGLLVMSVLDDPQAVDLAVDDVTRHADPAAKLKIIIFVCSSDPLYEYSLSKTSDQTVAVPQRAWAYRNCQSVSSSCTKMVTFVTAAAFLRDSMNKTCSSSSSSPISQDHQQQAEWIDEHFVAADKWQRRCRLIEQFLQYQQTVDPNLVLLGHWSSHWSSFANSRHPTRQIVSLAKQDEAGKLKSLVFDQLRDQKNEVINCLLVRLP